MERRVVALIGAVAVVGVGGWMALGGSGAFEALSGQPVPDPETGSVAALTAWSGVAAMRTVGAVMAAAGLVVIAGGLRPEPGVLRNTILAAGGFVVLVAVAQQMAIWESTFGWLLVGSLTVLTVAGSLAPGRRRSAAD